MKINPTLRGHFEYHQQGIGYDLFDDGLDTDWIGGQVPVHKLCINREHPMVFRQCDGTLIMCPDGIRTDGGSVKPMVAQKWIAKDRFMCAFINHDGAYQTRHFWVKAPGHQWEWVEINWFDANTLLMTMCMCDPIPCGWWKAHIVWMGVSAGGWVPWMLYAKNAREFSAGQNPTTWNEREYGPED